MNSFLHAKYTDYLTTRQEISDSFISVCSCSDDISNVQTSAADFVHRMFLSMSAELREIFFPDGIPEY